MVPDRQKVWTDARMGAQTDDANTISLRLRQRIIRAKWFLKHAQTKYIRVDVTLHCNDKVLDFHASDFQYIGWVVRWFLFGYACLITLYGYSDQM